MVDPPALPRRLSDVGTIAVVGTTLWLLGVVALSLAWLLGARELDIWFTTCLAGALLGGFGYSVFAWQRAATRRGSRMAQRGAE